MAEINQTIKPVFLETTGDTLLVKKVQSGDAKAFQQLVERWQKKIHRFAYRILQDSDDASEITQKTFIKVYHKLDTLDEPQKFPAWIYRVANNLCLDEMKRAGRRKAVPLDYRQEHSGSNGSPEKQLQQKELGEVLRQAMMMIPDEQRTVIIFKEYEGLTFREIAEILDESENTIKSRMYYGLKALRKVLKKWNIQHEYLNDD